MSRFPRTLGPVDNPPHPLTILLRLRIGVLGASRDGAGANRHARVRLFKKLTSSGKLGEARARAKEVAWAGKLLGGCEVTGAHGRAGLHLGRVARSPPDHPPVPFGGDGARSGAWRSR